MLKNSLLTFLGLLAGTTLGLPTNPNPNPQDLSPRQASPLSTLTTTLACATKAQKTPGDADSGRGVQIKNADTAARTFWLYHNSCDAVPARYVTIPAGQTRFLSLPARFEGRIVRGVEGVMLDGKSHTLNTWLELTYDERGVGWGDVSLIRGCDGAVSLKALDAAGATTGFADSNLVLNGAPAGAYDTKPSGSRVIRATEGVDAKINTVPRDWLASKIGFKKAYLDDDHGSPVIAAQNGRFLATFHVGRP
ncbi:uncharacterized protein GGS25DRAFT_534816 [Hypoxylon fragiforme]|uniref:uncharacterized protein n=1 Tax=Hypoxylon fragiforme TaxID=63214 RepID=UPI0020C6999E|nr:uncharacterized protein GGS25DRAFT_534816 [Hypoxylon fragiforme]KAI2604397.1 hypothetical protein GGS25DRAFT_534816 [Hypoxylon fragiforme]